MALTSRKNQDLDPKRIPEHIAIIMDGNGRWAKRRGLPRVAGHRAGVKTVDKIVEEATKLGIKFLTLYTFSSENWSRPEKEVNMLMELLRKNLVNQRQKLIKNNVRLRISGDLARFPEMVRSELEITVKETNACNRLTLNLALGYGGREEIRRAVTLISEKVKTGDLNSDEITDDCISDHLYTSGMPDPELIIRTSGEYRLSNFMLWQCSYSEFYFTSVPWPEFNKRELHSAIFDYQSRNRRFGGLSKKDSSSE